MKKKSYLYDPAEIYNDLRGAVERLHARLTHPAKQEAVGYVLQLFSMQDRDPMAFRQSEVLTSTEKKTHESGRKRPHESVGLPGVQKKGEEPAQHPVPELSGHDGVRGGMGQPEKAGCPDCFRKRAGAESESRPAPVVLNRLKLKEVAKARKNWSLTKLANQLDVDRHVLYSWNTGQRYPRFRDLLKLCALLSCTVEELIG